MTPNNFILGTQKDPLSKFKVTVGINDCKKTFEVESINQNWKIFKGKLNACS